jgi:Zn-finger nucleic acid-binding protein
MKCPNDATTLVMSERAGVEIDYCPECRGVWLDRGELDKIIDRAEAEASRAAPPGPSREVSYPPPEQRYDDRARGYDRGYDSRGSYRKKKKEHWLSELFD